MSFRRLGSRARPLGRWIRLALLLVALALIRAPAAVAVARDCPSLSIGVDTSFAALDVLSGLFGWGYGNTFLATDTLVRSISVWRNDGTGPNTIPIKLWITAVDSAGMPLTSQVILDGPALVVPAVEGDPRPTRIQYDFEPPFALPGPGRYAFFVQHICTGYFELLFSRSDQYAGGILWATGRSSMSGCHLRQRPMGLVDMDMVFEIEFCKDSATPVRTMPWGRLKVIYR